MWERLYSRAGQPRIPWTNQGPFPPLVRAISDGLLRPPGPILDIGCGVGTNSFWLAAQGFEVTGIDVAKGAIEAAESAREPGEHNPEFAAGDLLTSRLPPAKFRAAIDVGCFHTLPPRLRAGFAQSAHRLLAPGAPYLLFWVAREERGAWGPPHRLSVGEVIGAFEPWFKVKRIILRPRAARLTRDLMRTSRPLATLAGYTALFSRRAGGQPPAM